jgi:hypothetical protein
MHTLEGNTYILDGSRKVWGVHNRRYKVGERTIRDVRNNLTWKDTR